MSENALSTETEFVLVLPTENGEKEFIEGDFQTVKNIYNDRYLKGKSKAY